MDWYGYLCGVELVFMLDQNIYPISVIQMIEVGEETGETSRVLDKVGNFFEEEVLKKWKLR